MSSRLRIGIDAHAIGERKTGNERYIAGVLGEIRAVCDHEVVLYVTVPEAAARLRSEGHTVRVMRPRLRPARITASLPFLAWHDRLDVLLVQGTIPTFCPCPVVTAVHDVSFARYPEHFSPRERLWMTRTLPYAMRHAAGVITGSEFSRREMEEVYGIPPSRVVVAPYAVERRFAEEPPVASPAQPPYFLAVGNLQPRKNLVTLIAAMARLRRRHPHIPDRLVLAGQPAYLAAEVARVAAHHGAGGAVELLGYVSDDELVALLRSATALAYPSVYEGFGLPVVEAMAAGTPVLVSDIAVMREVAGDAAVFVSPRDPDAWADALAEVAADADLRSRLRAAGREREARYSWRACAESIVAALEGAARS